MDMSMDMGTSTAMSDMAMTMSSTASAAMASSTGMGDMDMSMGMGSCKINMLWNWYTIDACFLAESWHITSKGMFAGSCIGVIMLVVSLEFLRRAGKEYNRFIIAEHVKKYTNGGAAASSRASDDSEEDGVAKSGANASACATSKSVPRFRPSVLQQAIRALLHMLQFAVAYFIMLLAMYFNGYIIISIFIGAYIGSFIFSWETIPVGGAISPTSAGDEPTVCCG